MLSDGQIHLLKEWLGTGSINIFGMQFSGKDSQAQRLAGVFHAPVIGGGDILRNSEIPKHVQDQLDGGQYIDQNEYVRIVTPFLSQSKYAQSPLILSSVGRWIGEEQNIIGATNAAGHPLKAVVFLRIEEKTAFARLERSNRKRTDDTIANLTNRLKEFSTKTLPVIEVYRKMGLVLEVDGTSSIDEVAEDLLEKLYTFAHPQL